MTPEQAAQFADVFGKVVANVEQALMGKRHTVALAVTCLFTGGHLLLEDVPGTGKTLLAKALANTVQGSHHRIQFTPDLLPTDVTGVQIYDQRTGAFDFRPGPVFANVVLADEINRASPKTQSSLLEVMEEGQVTVDGDRHPVDAPFMVIATQNPIEQGGTYPLPEAQLDRFLMRTHLGHPDHATTVRLLSEAGTRDRSAAVRPLITTRAVADLVAAAATVHAEPAVLDYVGRIAEETRPDRAPGVAIGLSTRGALNLVRAAKTWAAANGRHFVVPDDVKHLAVPVLGHRILLEPEAEFAGTTVQGVIASILADVRPQQHRATVG